MEETEAFDELMLPCFADAGFKPLQTEMKDKRDMAGAAGGEILNPGLSELGLYVFDSAYPNAAIIRFISLLIILTLSPTYQFWLQLTFLPVAKIYSD